MKQQFLFYLLFTMFSIHSYSQVYENPIAGRQSHPELEITKIEITNCETIISLKITNNRSQGGWFCADKNIYIKNSNGIEKYKLLKAENVPTCPVQYNFTQPGQILEFKLYFEKISEKIKFIDFIKNCNNACFSFYGIILDNKHNEKIRAFEKGFELYQNNDIEKSIPFFKNVLEGKISVQSQIHGLSYYYLILIYKNLDNTDLVNYWYEKLLNSNIEDKRTFIKELENKISIN